MDDYTTTAEDVPRSPHKMSTSDQLCSTCRAINSQSLLHGKCGIELVSSGFSESQGSSDIVTLGPLQRISRTTSCPGCRLVSSCISVYSKWLASASVLYLCLVANSLERAARIGNTTDPQGLIFTLSIQIRGHDVKSIFDNPEP